MQKALFVLVAALIALTHAPSASAYGVARDYRHNQVASNVTPGAGRGSGWHGFSPTWIPGLALWLRADLGVTAVAGPVTATGTTPPTVTLSGTPGAQTAAATPYVELDCTTLGALGTSKYTVKVNGSVTATNVASASSGVALAGTNLTAGWAVGASATNDVYTANVVASAWVDQSGSGHSVTQATAAKQPTYLASDSTYAGKSALSFASAASQVMQSASWSLAQPSTVVVVANTDGAATQEVFTDFASTEMLLYQTGTHTTNIYAGTILGNGNNPASPGVVAGVYSGAASAVYRNFTNFPANGNAGTNTGAGGTLVGAELGPATFLNGKIVEVVMAATSISQSTLFQLFVYESNRYGFASQ